VRIANVHGRRTTLCYDVCLHSTVPIGAVPPLEKRPKTLTVLLTKAG